MSMDKTIIEIVIDHMENGEKAMKVIITESTNTGRTYTIPFSQANWENLLHLIAGYVIPPEEVNKEVQEPAIPPFTITQQMLGRWTAAQAIQNKYHEGFMNDRGVELFKSTYQTYFQLLGINDIAVPATKRILEIGSGPVPALAFRNQVLGWIIEPGAIFPGCQKHYQVAHEPAELVDFPEADEVWILNTLQHVYDPAYIIAKAKLAAPVVRIFEPLDSPVNETNIHSISVQFLKEQFGPVIKIFPANSGIPNFHTRACGYAVWRREDTTSVPDTTKIGILTTATGRFHDFVPQFMESLQNFCPGIEKQVFLFHDGDKEYEGVINIPTKHKKWPFVTLERYRRYTEASETILASGVTHLYHLDIDMRVVYVGTDILIHQLLAVEHPLYKGEKENASWWETNEKSNAFIPVEKRLCYVAGGFQGGFANAYMRECKWLEELVRIDLQGKGIIAIWHDESYFNKSTSYYICEEHNVVTILPPDYCYPEEMLTADYQPKIIALNKDKNLYR